ncbi:heparinase II/III family protein [Achromobacter insolitus]|uniref:heparinase II/III family protein n=1 Tax=Achromobacter insolitus TaxID=217204 RepID=UPI002FDFB3B0
MKHNEAKSKGFYFRADHAPALPSRGESEDIWNDFQFPGQIKRSGESWVKTGSAEKAKVLMERGEYPFNNFGPQPVSPKMNWALGGEGKANLSWQLHSLPFLRDLAFASTSINEDYFDFALSLVADWEVANTQSPLPSQFSWNDHSTAIRLINLSYFFLFALGRFRTRVDALRALTLTAERHIRVLMCDDFYVKGTNHGLDQAFALYQASLIFSTFDFSPAARTIALERLGYELVKSFSSEHIHIENSPEYHGVILSSTIQINSFIESCENNGVLGDTSKFINGAIEYFAHIIRPDGNLPTIGDSLLAPPRSDFAWLKSYESYPYFKHSYSRGAEGTPLQDAFKIFPESGYAIFHGNRAATQHDQQLHLVFKCGFLSHYHRQDDDNSVVLYAFGEDWLVDGGLYIHDLSDPIREYMRSQYSHNVVTPVGAKSERRICPNPPPRITEYSVNQNSASVIGFTNMYPGYEWLRLLDYQAGEKFTISDEISLSRASTSRDPQPYEQFWHIPHDKTIEISDGRVRIYSKEGTRVLHLEIETGASYSIQEQATEKGKLRCVRSLAYEKLEPCKVIHVQFSATDKLKVLTKFRFTSKD